MLRAHSNYRPAPALPSFHQYLAQARESFLSPDPFHPEQFPELGRVPHERHSGLQTGIDLSIHCDHKSPIVLPPTPLEFGATGDEVAALQAALLSLGYFGSGPLDSCTEKGIFEDKTFASLAT
jgi:hypothetical protein